MASLLNETGNTNKLRNGLPAKVYALQDNACTRDKLYDSSLQ